MGGSGNSDVSVPDVVVAGAGPVGLSLALSLARQGRRVLVLEREATTARQSRAPGIWPRTQEILAALGVLESFRAAGILLDRVTLWDADRDRPLLTLPLEELAGATGFPQLLILPQSRTEGLLADAVRGEATARILFSAEVVGVRQDVTSVSVEYRHDGRLRSVRAPFVVGCDGAHSAVRESLSIDLEGVTYDTRVGLADLAVTTPDDLPFPRLSTRAGLGIAIRMDADLWRIILPFESGDRRTLKERVEDAAVRLFPGVASAGEFSTVWESEFRLHRRVASSFVRDRVALAGDAAHLNSPVGGQGMNAGIQDAEVLSRALLEALRERDPGALRAYGRSRRSHVQEGVNPFTDRLTRVLLLSRGRAIRPALFLGRQALRVRPLRRRFLSRLAMLDTV